MANSDVACVVERMYDMEAPRGEWLTRVTASLRPVLDRHHPPFRAPASAATSRATKPGSISSSNQGTGKSVYDTIVASTDAYPTYVRTSANLGTAATVVTFGSVPGANLYCYVGNPLYFQFQADTVDPRSRLPPASRRAPCSACFPTRKR